MRISFYNNSDNNMIIAFSGQMICCQPKQMQTVAVEESGIIFEVSVDERSTLKNLSKVAGITYKYNFITAASYEFVLFEDTSIALSVEKKDGKHCETYTRVVAVSETALLSAPRYRIKDEADIRKQMKSSHRKGFGSVGVLAILGFLDDMVGWLCAAFLVALVIGILIFAEGTLIKVGIVICAAIVIGIILIINKIAGKLDKWVDKKLSKNKKEETADISVDIDLYKNEDSFFDTEYISSVFDK